MSQNADVFSYTFNYFGKPNYKDGLYYGRNKGFFPQTIVGVIIKKETAYVECFLPLKCEYFHKFSDTLTLYNKENILFLSEKSVIYFEKKKLFFKTIKGKYTIEETAIFYNPDKEKEFIEIKNKAKPFKK